MSDLLYQFLIEYYFHLISKILLLARTRKFNWSVSGYDGYWPLENSTNDLSGNNHNLQSGSVSYSTTSVRGTASASFNGTSNYLQYSDGTYLNQAITYFSYSFWVKPATLTGTQTLLDEGGGNKWYSH